MMALASRVGETLTGEVNSLRPFAEMTARMITLDPVFSSESQRGQRPPAVLHPTLSVPQS